LCLFHLASVKMDSKFIQGGHLGLFHNVYPECVHPYPTVSCAGCISRKGERNVPTDTLHAVCDLAKETRNLTQTAALRKKRKHLRTAPPVSCRTPHLGGSQFNEGCGDYALRVASGRVEPEGDEAIGPNVVSQDDKRTRVEKGSVLRTRKALGVALASFSRHEGGGGSKLEHAEMGCLLNNGPILDG